MTSTTPASANRLRFRIWIPEYGEGEEKIEAHMSYNPEVGFKDIQTREFLDDYTGDKITIRKIKVNNLFGPDVIWLQSTGLLDRQGKEIFEGDVVQWSQLYRYSVEWKQYGWHPFSCDGEGDHECHSGMHMLDVTEVIGNIYENPELLK